MRILVAENAIISSIMLEVSLVKCGYSVVVAENGEEAMDLLLSSNSPELALLDWNMPDMSGIDVCRQVRCKQNDHYNYIIMLTPASKVKDVQDCIDAGADDYILKPFFATELDVRIKAGLRIIRMQQELVYAKKKLKRVSFSNPLETMLLSVGNF